MHDEQLRQLLRTLDGERTPDPAFADSLYGRLSLRADAPRGRRAPWTLLAAAALLVVLAAGVAVGSGWVRLPVVVDTPGPASPTASAVAVASTSLAPSPAPSEDPGSSPSADPSEAPEPGALAGAILFAEADGLRIRSEPAEDADVLATLRRGQLMGATGERRSVGETDWYEVHIGPGDLGGWVAAGPDGEWLKLVEDGAVTFRCDGCAPDGPRVVSVTPFGDADIRLLTSDELTEWRWSPDGSRLVASRGGTTLPYRIVVLAPDGAELDDLGVGVAAAWSPDGSSLAWLGDGLVVTNDELEPAVIDIGGIQPGAPFWSPDGTRLAMVGAEDTSLIDPPVRLLVVPSVGGQAVELIEPGTLQAFSWAPDGSQLVYVEVDLSGQQPSRALVVPSNGGVPTPILEGVAIMAAPAWSPDGTRIAASSPDGIVLANGDGSQPVVLVPAAEGETIGELRWSPSGAWLSYTTSSGREPTLWIVPADGSDAPRAISGPGVGAQQAEWQPILADLP